MEVHVDFPQQCLQDVESLRLLPKKGTGIAAYYDSWPFCIKLCETCIQIEKKEVVSDAKDVNAHHRKHFLSSP